MIGLLLWVGCPSELVEPEVCASVGWEDFAQGYVTTWCTPCHTSSLEGADRHGAPPGMDFDRWSDVHRWRSEIAERATGPAPDMPPLGGVDPEDVERFAGWLACGAKGADPPPGPCDTLRPGPATTVASQADADRLCASANQVASLTVTGAATIDCLCGVDGDLRVSGDLVLPLVSGVGDLVLEAGSLDAPALETVDTLTVTGGATSLTVPALRTVAGDVGLTDLLALTDLSFDALLEVGGEWVVARSPTLVTVDVPRLRRVGGTFLQEDLSAFSTLAGTRALERIGGDLVLHRMPRLEVLDDWSFLLLAEVGGDVVLEDNAALVAIHGFTSLPAVTGDVRIERNGSLRRIDGFDLLLHVTGDVVLRGNVRQTHVSGFVNLERIDGALVFEDLPEIGSVAGFDEVQQVGALRFTRFGADALLEFAGLQTVTGDLVLVASPRITRVSGFDALTAVGGDLRVVDNLLLSAIDGWFSVGVVGGSVEVQDNPELPTSTVEGWVDGIDIGGTVTVEDNGPG